MITHQENTVCVCVCVAGVIVIISVAELVLKTFVNDKPVAGEPSGCCAKGMLAEEAPADLPECCVEGRALLTSLSGCCMNVLRTGEEGKCCTGMGAAVAAKFAQ